MMYHWGSSIKALKGRKDEKQQGKLFGALGNLK